MVENKSIFDYVFLLKSDFSFSVYSITVIVSATFLVHYLSLLFS